MFDGAPVIDADSHKCENPVVFLDYVEAAFRDRIGFIRDRYGEQRFRIRDRNPETGRNDFERPFLQPDGYGKGTYRPYHDESTIGGLFNRVRLEHMDREGIDHQVLYGSIPLAFNSLIDRDLASALCRAYNDYIHDDCAAYAARLHPVGILPLQDPTEAIAELRRCTDSLGMVAVTTAPHVPVPHPDAPQAFPRVRVPKHLSHPDFTPLLHEIERRDVSLGLHGAPGVSLAGGAADQLDSFTLVHVFANRSLQQMALARLIFDGTLERHPALRVGFLEAGCGWLPDFMWSLDEHWEKRVAGLDVTLEPSPREFLVELARERQGRSRGRFSRARGLLRMLFTPAEDAATPEELRRFRYEHPELVRDPMDYLEPGRTFFTLEPDDPAPDVLYAGFGERGEALSGLAIDYGHWDATLRDCVRMVAEHPAWSVARKRKILSENARRFYGRRLESRLEPPPPRRARPSSLRPNSPFASP